MTADGVMDNIRNLFEQSGMTLNELGEGLGYNGPTAKKRAVVPTLSHVQSPHLHGASCGPIAGRENQ